VASPIIRIEQLCLSFSHFPLLENASLQILPKERICLVGRNGTGKSTLLKSIAGQLDIHQGEIWIEPTAKLAYLAQELPENSDMTVFDYVAEGLSSVGKLLSEHHSISNAIKNSEDDGVNTQTLLKKLDKVQAEIEVQDGWRFGQRIEEVLARMSLYPNARLKRLSGGLKRKAAMARALVIKPDILLMDEPTNHLDIQTIYWLEEELLNFNGTLIFITHDRALVRKLATKIVEVDRGNLISYPGSYDKFLEQKEKRLQDEDSQNKLFDKKLAR